MPPGAMTAPAAGVGKYADLILLDRDLYSITPHEIGATEVLLTLTEGQEVHRHAGFVG